MEYMKKLVLFSALSFAIASSAFAKTVPTTMINYDGTSIMQSKKVAVKKVAVKKVSKKAPKKAAVKKVAVKNNAVNKVAENKAPLSKAPENQTPITEDQDTKPTPSATPIEPKKEIDSQTPGDSDLAKWTPPETKEEVNSPKMDDSDLLKWTALDVELDIETQPLSNYRAYFVDEPSSVPVPAAAWLLGSALIGFVSFSKRRNI
jgi:hypothetical protein